MFGPKGIMPSQIQETLARRRAKKAASASDPAPTAQQKPLQKINPEIDQRLTAFMASNPKLTEHFRQMPQELLVRKLMLAKMFEADRQVRRTAEVVGIAMQNPQIAASIERGISGLPPEKQLKEARSIAFKELIKVGVNAVKSSNSMGY